MSSGHTPSQHDRTDMRLSISCFHSSSAGTADQVPSCRISEGLGLNAELCALLCGTQGTMSRSPDSCLWFHSAELNATTCPSSLCIGAPLTSRKLDARNSKCLSLSRSARKNPSMYVQTAQCYARFLPPVPGGLEIFYEKRASG